ncbi:hypothetical protein D8T57_15800 [Vibrio vulnificus]|uniref:Abi family protein n=1 Tax=Vibrio vulnificus TaxID=672 RepID=UPI00102B6C9B|nr:Abi family protein [Vibrio vulnificus]RZR43728.1 hypothetical protein D8T57_15800 [Vibrio vulnificus]
MARFDNHSSIEHLISEPRLRSYREVFEYQSDEELYGAYEWNKAVVACFAPLNQIVEVTLRNAIHNALSDRYVGHWYRRPTYSSFAPRVQGQPRAREPHAVYNLKNNFKNAHDKAYDELQRKGIGGTPTVGQVIAKTDFSTWEYALDTEFYDGSGADNRYFWPQSLGTVFQTWPLSGSLSTLNHIQDLVKSIRLFRNRLSHNEPAWKHSSVHTEEDVFVYLNRKIEIIESLIGWISQDKLLYIQQQGWFEHAKNVCKPEALKYYQGKERVKTVRSWRQLKRNLSSDMSVLKIKSGQVIEVKEPQLKIFE